MVRYVLCQIILKAIIRNARVELHWQTIQVISSGIVSIAFCFSKDGRLLPGAIFVNMKVIMLSNQSQESFS